VVVDFSAAKVTGCAVNATKATPEKTDRIRFLVKEIMEGSDEGR
jgi:hypothetical protein